MMPLRAGQSITEYAVVIGMVAAAMIGMQTFIRRYVQAEVRAKTDDLLAVSSEDALQSDAQLRGMQTQRLGVERFRENEGIAGGNTIYDASSHSSRELSEVVTSGKTAVGEDESHQGRAGQQQVTATRPNPAPTSVPPGPWFRRRDEQTAVPRDPTAGRRRPNP